MNYDVTGIVMCGKVYFWNRVKLVCENCMGSGNVQNYRRLAAEQRL